MSTTFGVKVKIADMEHFANYTCIEDDYEYGIIPVAFRGNGIRFTSPLAVLLPNDTPVIAIDNGQQGIYTIGDIKQSIKKIELGDNLPVKYNIIISNKNEHKLFLKKFCDYNIHKKEIARNYPKYIIINSDYFWLKSKINQDYITYSFDEWNSIYKNILI